MKSKNFIKVSLWVLITILVLSLGFTCLNAPSTSKAIIGFIIIIAWISISYETNLFEKIKLKRLFKKKFERDGKHN
jgi:hypothetical protein